MRPARFNIVPDIDADGLKTSGTLTAGAITLNGALISDSMWIANDQTGQLVTVTSSANETLTISVTGNDVDGKAVVGSIALSNANIAVGDIYMSKITGMSSSTISVGAVTIGLLGEASSPTFVPNYKMENFKAAIAVVPTGTVNGTVQHTFDDVFEHGWLASDATWFNHDDTDLVGFTAKQNGNYAFPPTGTRCIINSASAGGEIEFTVIVPS